MTRHRHNADYSLTWPVRTAMVLRSFFIQATNNFERMLSLGFAYALFPALKRAYPSPEERVAAVRRHLAFFNTQPYFANSILGIVANAEIKARRDNVAAETTAIKRAMMGAFGALGDDLFWAALMPGAATLALLVYVVEPAWAVAGAAAALLIYNGVHLWVRIRVFEMSLKLGRRVTRYYRLLRLPRLAMRVKLAGAFVLGATALTVAIRSGAESHVPWGPLAFGGTVVSLYLLIRFGLKPELCWYAACGAAVAAGVVFL